MSERGLKASRGRGAGKVKLVMNKNQEDNHVLLDFYPLPVVIGLNFICGMYQLQS